METEIAASIDLGLGAGGINESSFNNEMVVLTREIRDILLRMSGGRSISGQEGDVGFGGGIPVSGGGFGRLLSGLAGGAAGLTALLNPEVVKEFSEGINDLAGEVQRAIFEPLVDSLYGEGTYEKNMEEHQSFLDEVNENETWWELLRKKLFGGGDNQETKDDGESSFFQPGMNIENLKGFGERQANNFLKEREQLIEEINDLLVDGIENEEEMSRIQELRSELSGQTVEYMEERLGKVSDEQTIEDSILRLNNERLSVLSQIGEELKNTAEDTVSVAQAQEQVNRSVEKEIQLRQRLKRLREDKGTRTTTSSRGSTRYDTTDGRTFAEFNTPALGGTKVFEII